MDLHAATQFMLAVKRQMMKHSDYVYILPWLAHVSTRVFWSLLVSRLPMAAIRIDDKFLMCDARYRIITLNLSSALGITESI